MAASVSAAIAAFQVIGRCEYKCRTLEIIILALDWLLSRDSGCLPLRVKREAIRA
jgi:hypothetical protein